MVTQVDPAAYQNAFYAHQDFTQRNRLAQQQQAQQGVENERQNRLLALQEGQAGLQREQFDQQQQQLQRQNQIAATDRQINIFRTQLAPFAQRAIASGRPQAFVSAALADPAFQPIFREAGFDLSKIDVNSPDFMQTLEAIAGMADPTLQNNTPSNVREWLYYNSLPPQEKQAYLEMKRAQQTFLPTIGNVPTVVRPGVAGGPTQMQPLTDIGSVAGNAAAVAGAETSAREGAKVTAGRQADLPRVEQNASEALNVIDQLLASPGLPYITGFYSKAPIVPNTPQAAADALARQIEGKVFMEAFTTLKGGGQITEKEGEKATAALARLNRAQNLKDYKAAVMEMRSIIETGLSRARSAAGASPAQPASGGWSVEVVQ